MPTPSPFSFDHSLEAADPELAHLVTTEEQRQQAKLILIASESLCPRPVREASVSPFSAIYAEGYPSTRMTQFERHLVSDRDRHLAFNRRYADRRYYKGCEYVNFVEILAQKRAAEVFAANGVRPDDIYVNVQPLSGSGANNAIYTAFVEPGDLVMGMALPHGGHLSHGSHLNRSGKLYRIVPYMVDAKTGRLDYDAIKDAARIHRPRILIAGASAYPWHIDWKALREAADQVPGRRCLLLADISHPSGLVAAGEFPSPIGYADVISLTTHKTLCGPRGAIIMTTDRDDADQVDLGVFPGEQGGPHIQQIAAKAVAFRLANTDTFRQLMRRVRENATTLASAVAKEGLRIQGGGTESHLLLVDLKGHKTRSGVPLFGDIAANLLDLAGITTNKNTIIGDESAAHPTGLRLGTTVLSQQGFGPKDMETIAGWIGKIVRGCDTFTVTTGGGQRGRARIDHDVLEEVRAGVAALTGREIPDVEPTTAAPSSTAISVRGERAPAFLQSVVTSDVMELQPGQEKRTQVLDRAGQVMADAVVRRVEADAAGFPAYSVEAHPTAIRVLQSWFRGLSDGYVAFDADPTRKVDGPVALHPSTGKTQNGSALPPPSDAASRQNPDPKFVDGTKPWFLGRDSLQGLAPAKPQRPFTFSPVQSSELRKTSLNPLHRALTAPHNMVPFAGWDMPVLYTSIFDEHRMVRKAGGLFDLAHMGTMDIRGPGAARFLDLLTTNFVWRIQPGQSQYTYILDPTGRVMDDLLIYRLGVERYLVVANAANADEVLAWFRAVASGEVRISEERPDLRMDAFPEIRDLKDSAQSGDDCVVDLGFQGPHTKTALLRFADGHPKAQRIIADLRKSEQQAVEIGSFRLVISRTGYTGEEVGYEIFVHPEQAPELWQKLLAVSADLGIGPAGLGSRDSLRAEAGFPLYGHELAGELSILPAEAGYGSFVKEHKPFFVGREPHLLAARASRRRIVRMQFEHTGIRMFQPKDPVVNGRGSVVGAITSTILPGDRQIALALVDQASSKPGTRLGAFLRPRRPDPTPQRPIQDLTIGDTVAVPEPALVLERFPKASCDDATVCS